MLTSLSLSLPLKKAWQKPKYKDRAQNLLCLVERMNNLTLWVATTILSQRVSHLACHVHYSLLVDE